jgi:cytochrome c55X
MPGKAAVSLCLLALVVLPLAAAADPTPKRQGELIHLLRHDCGSCHGLTLKGGLGPPLLPGDLEGLPPEGLAAIILDGVPGRPMPPWRGLLPESEVVWLVGKLQRGIDDAH